MKTECGVAAIKKAKEEREELRRGPWTPEEDDLLIRAVACHGEGRWNLLAKSAGLKRNGKSCRLRWLNYLKPDIKRGDLTPQEQLLILELHSNWGNRWSKIAAALPGRTDNEIKNYWRTRVQKQARQLNMESNSPSFIDAIRCYYMPRLVQKIEQTSTLTNLTSLNSDQGSSGSSPSQNSHPIYSPDTMLESDHKNKYISSSNVNTSNAINIYENTQPSNITPCYQSYGYDDVDMALIPGSNKQFSNLHVAGYDWLWDDMALDDQMVLDGLW